MTFTFTESGLLTPAAGIETRLEVIEQQFVRAFPISETRQRLFENFQNYLSRFQHEIFPWFKMWVDGSFVTLKGNPKDVDVVTFLDWEVWKLRTKSLEKFYSYNLEKEGIDAYIVPVYPKGHIRHPEFVELQNRWKARFEHGDGDSSKGYLILNFGKIIE